MPMATSTHILGASQEETDWRAGDACWQVKCFFCSTSPAQEQREIEMPTKHTSFQCFPQLGFICTEILPLSSYPVTL